MRRPKSRQKNVPVDRVKRRFVEEGLEAALDKRQA